MNDRASWIAWAAGIIQGEGCIGLYARKGRKRKRPMIMVAQTDDDGMLLRLRQLWGGYISNCSAYGRTRSHKRWWLGARKALEACEELLACEQFSGPKRFKAEQVVAHYEIMDKKRESDGQYRMALVK